MEGVTLTAPVKEDILGRLRLAMEHGKLTLPRDDTRLLVQITSQRCKPTMSGTLKFSHPTGTHDDPYGHWDVMISGPAECPARTLRILPDPPDAPTTICLVRKRSEPTTSWVRIPPAPPSLFPSSNFGNGIRTV
jgi:hypothetical protein